MIFLVLWFCNYLSSALTIIYYTTKAMVRFSHIKHTDSLCNHTYICFIYFLLKELSQKDHYFFWFGEKGRGGEGREKKKRGEERKTVSAWVLNNLIASVQVVRSRNLNEGNKREKYLFLVTVFCKHSSCRNSLPTDTNINTFQNEIHEKAKIILHYFRMIR